MRRPRTDLSAASSVHLHLQVQMDVIGKILLRSFMASSLIFFIIEAPFPITMDFLTFPLHG